MIPIACVQRDIDVLKAVAHKRIPGPGWTLSVNCWEDDQYQVFYVHGEGSISHRFRLHSNSPDSILYEKADIEHPYTYHVSEKEIILLD